MEMEITEAGEDLLVRPVRELNLDRTLDCGQAFRWRKDGEGIWHGVVRGVPVSLAQEEQITFFHTSKEEFKRIWYPYFDLGRDYSAVSARLCEDPVLARAVREYRGIRILRQEPWEALCSFIISQNNNIPRIKGIIERLCGSFGEEIAPGWFSFPSPERLAGLEPEELSGLRAGFRARYIIDAARKTAAGLVSLEKLADRPTEEAREELMTITGVGAKVADCTLLYGLGKLEVCPMDVWMKRVVGAFYPEGLPACTRGIQGIAQQYLFHYARTSGVLNAG